MLAPESALVAPSSGPDNEDLRSVALRSRTDPDAFGVLYRRCVGRVYGFALRRSGSAQVAEEVTAATFEKAWRAMPGFEWRGGGVEPWLFSIAASELTSLYRREARPRRPRAQAALQSLAGPADPGPDDPRDPGQAVALRSALAQLPDRYQRALALRYLSGLSNEAAAEAMGCSRPVMAVTLHRALTALRRVMPAEGESG